MGYVHSRNGVVGLRKAPEWKAEHVFVIGLDGMGRLQCGKGGYAEREGVDGCRMLHVEKTQCTSFIQCCNWAPCLWEQDRSCTDIRSGDLVRRSFLPVS